MEVRKSFILHYDSLDVIDILTDEQVWKLLKKMKSYHLNIEYDTQDKMVDIAFIQFKNQFDRDIEKYNNVCERNKNNGLKWWRPKKPENPVDYLETENIPEESKKPYNDNDSKSDNKSDSDNDNKNKLILSKDKEQSSLVKVGKRDLDIDNLIKELKDTADNLKIAYDKNKDRNFAKFILTAKEYWNFCEKIWQDRIDFAKNIMLASVKIWFWKWICAWPMMIYQNYSEVYNKAVEKKNNTNNNLIYKI